MYIHIYMYMYVYLHTYIYIYICIYRDFKWSTVGPVRRALAGSIRRERKERERERESQSEKEGKKTDTKQKKNREPALLARTYKATRYTIAKRARMPLKFVVRLYLNCEAGECIHSDIMKYGI